MRVAIAILTVALCLSQRSAVFATEPKLEGDPKDHWAFKTPQRPTLPKDQRGLHPIDALLSVSHEKHGLTPLGEARREFQLRRLCLDLIGLPPTREELHAFLADNSPDAYERCVDRLLNDARHGERWARHWMDVWRYSDWFGRRRVPDVWNSAAQVWRWRDWIVRSINTDKGYDRMVQEMLAGDEIAPDDAQTVVATGFLVRNWYALNPNQWMRDNVEHTGKAFLGLSFNCAHCHDHKYDPITREDYFAFRAFFEPLYIRQDRWPGEKDPGKFQDYAMSVLRKPVREGMVSVFDKDPDAKTWLYTGGDERNRETDRSPATPHMPAFLGGDVIRATPVSLTTEKSFPGLKKPSRADDLAASMKAIEAAISSWQEAIAKLGQARRAMIEAADADDATRVSCVTQEQEAARTATLEEARFHAAMRERASLQARIAADDVKFGGKTGDMSALSKAACEEERVTAVAKAKLSVLEAEQKLAAGAEKERAAPAGPEREAATAAQKKMTAQCDAAKKALANAEADLKKPAADYTPLSPVYPKESTGRRKALAEWITSTRNPLTARVAVNHIWMHHFHAPLVASVFDFGRGGSPPTHPALLDWLAVELMDSGWSMKHLHRIIVTSAAYRRASSDQSLIRETVESLNRGNAPSDSTVQRFNGSTNVHRPELENALLLRMNPGRMEAEAVRDSILHLAGALDPKMGGQELENTEMPDSTRRSLYFSCHPELGGKGEFTSLFDAPDAAECYRRSCTVVPQQALALTNSKMVHDQSAPLAKRIAQGIDTGDTTAFVTAAFEHLLSRKPDDTETQECLAFLARQLSATGSESAARESLARVLLNHNDFLTIR
jgi:hypothetical protein